MKTKTRYVGPLEKTLYLKSIEAIRDLSAQELAIIAQKAKEQFFRKGSVIMRPGEPVGSFHLIVEGQVRAEGAEHGGAIIGEQHSVGLLSLLSEWPEGVHAVAESDTLTLGIEADDLHDVFEDHFSILHHQVQNIARRLLALRKETPDGAYFAPAEGLLPSPSRELDLIERLLYWTRGGAFQSSSMDAMIELACNSKEVRVDAGEVLWRSGEPSGFIYLIIAGTVRCVLDEDGRSFRCGPGYPLGNVESLSRGPRWFEAEAETPIIALRTETDQFIDTLEDHFGMAIEFMAGMARGLVRTLDENRKSGAA